MNTPFDIFQQQVGAQQQVKSAADVAFENAYWEAMAEKSASFENEQIRELFNAAFEDHTAKLASLDPEYGAMLHEEQVKMAFNQAFEETLAYAYQG